VRRTHPAWIALLLAAACLPSCRRPQEEPRVRIAGGMWRVELALDQSTREKGLADRDEVADGTGMLFVFGREEVHSFHMLNCRVPLDVAFISARLHVVEIRTMPVEADPADPKVIYSSRRPARYALEVAAGALARSGVQIGDRVELLGHARHATKEAR